MFTTVLVIVTTAFTGLLIGLVRRSRTVPRCFDEFEKELRVVNLRAFQNLTAPGEMAFLRSRLSSSEFRKSQRLRMRAAMTYLSTVGHNAGILIRIGELAQQCPDGRVADAGQELTAAALRTRMLVIAAYARVLPAWLFPSLEPAQCSSLFARYALLRDELTYLVSLQHPGHATEAAALLSN